MFAQALLVGSFALGSYAQISGSSVAFGISSSSSSSASPSPVVAQTTLNLFADSTDDYGFVGSIVSADSCETTIALYCTEGELSSGFLSATCDPSQSALATYGSGYFEVSSAVTTSSVKLTVYESCSLAGTTEAVCFVSLRGSADGQQTQTTSTVTRTGGEVNYYQVPITAGASKIKGLAACTSTAGNAAAPTGAVDIVKVLVVPGAAALLAGMHAFA